MNIRSLEYFIVAAEEMNFTKASERLFITQQALSAHIKRLEAEYGVRLFHRTPALQLTLEGEQMLFYARQILNSNRQMKASFSDTSINYRGKVKIGISRLRTNNLIPAIWKYYHKEHPNISLEIISGNTDTFAKLLQAGKIDFFIGVDVAENANTKRIELAEERLQCCFSHSLLLKYRPDDWEELLENSKDGIDLTQIWDFPFMMFRKNNRLRHGLEQWFRNQPTYPNIIFECEQQDLICKLAKDGNGAALLSPIALYNKQASPDSEQPEDKLYTFPIKNAITTNTVHLCYNSQGRLPQYTLDLIDTFVKVFHQYSKTL